MHKISIRLSILIGILLILPFLALLFLARTITGVTFPAYPLFDLLSRLLPGGLITFGIDSIVDTIRVLNLGPTDSTAKSVEQVMAVALLATAGIVLSVFYFRLAQQLKRGKPASRYGLLTGLCFGALVGIPVAFVVVALDHTSIAAPVINILWTLVSFMGWGAAHGLVFSKLTSRPTSTTMVALPEPSPATPPNTITALSRRQFLIQLGGATATITLLGIGLSAWQMGNRLVDTLATPTDEAASLLSDNGLHVAPGTRPEYTPLSKHYRIDINTGGPPTIDGDTYKLVIDGLVGNPVELTLDQIRAYEAMDQIITMSCISNRIGGDLISTIRWTGISMQHILDLVKPDPTATHIKITGQDGFYEVLALDAIRADKRIMLTYAWDGQPLPVRNGFPLRIHIPDHYGMKQPKWITRMEFTPVWEEGYWVERGWDREARVNATSVIDTVAVNNLVEKDANTKLVPIGGIAWAGARGISRVEVQVDKGEWVQAELRDPLSDKSWVLWRYDWPFVAGSHSFTVRCFETGGAPQIVSERGAHPSGATGLHSVSASL